jgi:hypothetical protein
MLLIKIEGETERPLETIIPYFIISFFLKAQ